MNAQYDTLDCWTELRTAYLVAKLGTLSAAAAQIGVHHSTVIRHIDTVEARLGCKLFHRHPRGYVSTESGQELMAIAATTEDQFSQLALRLQGQRNIIRGDLIVTTLSSMSEEITPLLIRFREVYPEIRISLIADERRLKLEYGEAHVALRAGTKPQEPDNVVQPLCTVSSTLYAHKDYVKKHGLLLGEDDLKNHFFVSGMDIENSRAPHNEWAKQNVPEACVVFKATQARSQMDAINGGAGIGFLTKWSALSNPDLIEMMPRRPEWNGFLWIVTHVDLHRTAKVQAFLKFLKQNFNNM